MSHETDHLYCEVRKILRHTEALQAHVTSLEECRDEVILRLESLEKYCHGDKAPVVVAAMLNETPLDHAVAAPDPEVQHRFERYAETIRQLEETENKLRAEIETLRFDTGALVTHRDEIRKQLQKERDAHAETKSRLESKESVVAARDAESAKLLKERDETCAKLRKEHAEYITTRSSLDHRNTQLASTGKRINDLEDEIASYRRDATSKDIRINCLDVSCKQLAGDLQRLEIEKEHLAVDLMESEAELTETKSRIADLTQSITEYAATITRQDHRIGQLEKQITDLQYCTRDLEHARANLLIQGKESETLRQRLDVATTRMREAETTTEHLRAERSELSTRVKTLMDMKDVMAHLVLTEAKDS